jgi:hypothetical protein
MSQRQRRRLQVPDALICACRLTGCRLPLPVGSMFDARETG